ncbi:MAG: hypothetical protein DMG06_27375 [Acidobacteria bacterium]|nr:MAG: hypothetical protein DMG06_27375 [Acidobacteriota bacterium]
MRSRLLVNIATRNGQPAGAPVWDTPGSAVLLEKQKEDCRRINHSNALITFDWAQSLTNSARVEHSWREEESGENEETLGSASGLSGGELSFILPLTF